MDSFEDIEYYEVEEIAEKISDLRSDGFYLRAHASASKQDVALILKQGLKIEPNNLNYTTLRLPEDDRKAAEMIANWPYWGLKDIVVVNIPNDVDNKIIDGLLINGSTLKLEYVLMYIDVKKNEIYKTGRPC